MKRRDFMALLSTVGVGTALGEVLVGREGGGTADNILDGGSISLSHWRQGAGFPVTVDLVLPNGEGLDHPRPLVIREGAEGWFEEVAELGAIDRVGRDSWRWEWIPPLVRPTSEETSAEIVRYRLVLLDEDSSSPPLLSAPVEVVCVHRGWGC